MEQDRFPHFCGYQELCTQLLLDVVTLQGHRSIHWCYELFTASQMIISSEFQSVPFDEFCDSSFTVTEQVS
jgi:hypothetical protein